MSFNRDNTIFIMAGGFGREGILCEGYKVFLPYKNCNIFGRILREICFRTPLLPKKIWYRNDVTKENPEYVLVTDPLITVEYLNWVKKLFPKAQLNFTYGNMIGKARHVFPDKIPDGWRIWTYDSDDSKKYGIRLFNTNAYYSSFVKPLKVVKYDVLFIGRDKGRGEYLLQLEQKLQTMGLKTKFIITADGRFSHRKSYYQNEISYNEIIDLITQSRSILNIALEGQKGMTIRDLESIFFGVKLVTTNKNVINMDFYQPENVFILEGLNVDGLPAFLDTKTVEVSAEIKQKHTLKSYIDEITR